MMRTSPARRLILTPARAPEAYGLDLWVQPHLLDPFDPNKQHTRLTGPLHLDAQALHFRHDPPGNSVFRWQGEELLVDTRLVHLEAHLWIEVTWPVRTGDPVRAQIMSGVFRFHQLENVEKSLKGLGRLLDRIWGKRRELSVTALLLSTIGVQLEILQRKDASHFRVSYDKAVGKSEVQRHLWQMALCPDHTELSNPVTILQGHIDSITAALKATTNPAFSLEMFEGADGSGLFYLSKNQGTPEAMMRPTVRLTFKGLSSSPISWTATSLAVSLPEFRLEELSLEQQLDRLENPQSRPASDPGDAQLIWTAEKEAPLVLEQLFSSESPPPLAMVGTDSTRNQDGPLIWVLTELPKSVSPEGQRLEHTQVAWTSLQTAQADRVRPIPTVRPAGLTGPFTVHFARDWEVSVDLAAGEPSERMVTVFRIQDKLGIDILLRKPSIRALSPELRVLQSDYVDLTALPAFPLSSKLLVTHSLAFENGDYPKDRCRLELTLKKESFHLDSQRQGALAYLPTGDALIDLAPPSSQPKLVATQIYDLSAYDHSVRDPNHGLSVCELGQFAWTAIEDSPVLVLDSKSHVKPARQLVATMALLPWVEVDNKSPESVVYHRNLIQEHAEFAASASDRGAESRKLPPMDYDSIRRAVRDPYLKAAILGASKEGKLLNWLPGSSLQLSEQVIASPTIALKSESPFPKLQLTGLGNEIQTLSLDQTKGVRPWLEVGLDARGWSDPAKPVLKLDPLGAIRTGNGGVPLIFSQALCLDNQGVVRPQQSQLVKGWLVEEIFHNHHRYWSFTTTEPIVLASQDSGPNLCFRCQDLIVDTHGNPVNPRVSPVKGLRKPPLQLSVGSWGLYSDSVEHTWPVLQGIPLYPVALEHLKLDHTGLDLRIEVVLSNPLDLPGQDSGLRPPAYVEEARCSDVLALLTVTHSGPAYHYELGGKVRWNFASSDRGGQGDVPARLSFLEGKVGLDSGRVSVQLERGGVACLGHVWELVDHPRLFGRATSKGTSFQTSFPMVRAPSVEWREHTASQFQVAALRPMRLLQAPSPQASQVFAWGVLGTEGQRRLWGRSQATPLDLEAAIDWSLAFHQNQVYQSFIATDSTIVIEGAGKTWKWPLPTLVPRRLAFLDSQGLSVLIGGDQGQLCLLQLNGTSQILKQLDAGVTHLSVPEMTDWFIAVDVHGDLTLGRPDLQSGGWQFVGLQGQNLVQAEGLQWEGRSWVATLAPGVVGLYELVADTLRLLWTHKLDPCYDTARYDRDHLQPVGGRYDLSAYDLDRHRTPQLAIEPASVVAFSSDGLRRWSLDGSERATLPFNQFSQANPLDAQGVAPLRAVATTLLDSTLAVASDLGVVVISECTCAQPSPVKSLTARIYNNERYWLKEADGIFCLFGPSGLLGLTAGVAGATLAEDIHGQPVIVTLALDRRRLAVWDGLNARGLAHQRTLDKDVRTLAACGQLVAINYGDHTPSLWPIGQEPRPIPDLGASTASLDLLQYAEQTWVLLSLTDATKSLLFPWNGQSPSNVVSVPAGRALTCLHGRLGVVRIEPDRVEVCDPGGHVMARAAVGPTVTSLAGQAGEGGVLLGGQDGTVALAFTGDYLAVEASGWYADLGFSLLSKTPVETRAATLSARLRLEQLLLTVTRAGDAVGVVAEARLVQGGYHAFTLGEGRCHREIDSNPLGKSGDDVIGQQSPSALVLWVDEVPQTDPPQAVVQGVLLDERHFVSADWKIFFPPDRDGACFRLSGTVVELSVTRLDLPNSRARVVTTHLHAPDLDLYLEDQLLQDSPTLPGSTKKPIFSGIVVLRRNGLLVQVPVSLTVQARALHVLPMVYQVSRFLPAPRVSDVAIDSCLPVPDEDLAENVNLVDVTFPTPTLASPTQLGFARLLGRDGQVTICCLDGQRIPLDLCLDTHATQDLPTQPLSVPQLVHHQVYGGRLRVGLPNSDSDFVDRLPLTGKTIDEGTFLLQPVLDDGRAISVYRESVFVAQTGSYDQALYDVVAYPEEELLSWRRYDRWHYDSVQSPVSPEPSLTTENVLVIQRPSAEAGDAWLASGVSCVMSQTMSGARDLYHPENVERIQEDVRQQGAVGILLRRLLVSQPLPANLAQGSPGLRIRYEFVPSPFFAQDVLSASGLGGGALPESGGIGKPFPPSLLPPGLARLREANLCCSYYLREASAELSEAVTLPGVPRLGPSSGSPFRSLSIERDQPRYDLQRYDERSYADYPRYDHASTSYNQSRYLDNLDLPFEQSKPRQATPYLHVREVTAFETMQPLSSRSHLKEPASMLGRNCFLPESLQMVVSADKPGAMMHHLIQAMHLKTENPKGLEVETVRQVALRDPQQFRMQTGAAITLNETWVSWLEGEAARPGLIRLSWTERLGAVNLERLSSQLAFTVTPKEKEPSAFEMRILPVGGLPYIMATQVGFDFLAIDPERPMIPVSTDPDDPNIPLLPVVFLVTRPGIFRSYREVKDNGDDGFRATIGAIVVLDKEIKPRKKELAFEAVFVPEKCESPPGYEVYRLSVPFQVSLEIQWLCKFDPGSKFHDSATNPFPGIQACKSRTASAASSQLAPRVYAVVSLQEEVKPPTTPPPPWERTLFFGEAASPLQGKIKIDEDNLVFDVNDGALQELYIPKDLATAACTVHVVKSLPMGQLLHCSQTKSTTL